MVACARSGKPDLAKHASMNAPLAAIALTFLPLVVKRVAVLGLPEVWYWLA